MNWSPAWRIECTTSGIYEILYDLLRQWRTKRENNEEKETKAKLQCNRLGSGIKRRNIGNKIVGFCNRVSPSMHSNLLHSRTNKWFKSLNYNTSSSTCIIRTYFFPFALTFTTLTLFLKDCRTLKNHKRNCKLSMVDVSAGKGNSVCWIVTTTNQLNLLFKTETERSLITTSWKLLPSSSLTRSGSKWFR